MKKPSHPFTSATRLSLKYIGGFPTEALLTPHKNLTKSEDSHSEISAQNRRPVAFRPTLTDGLALS